MASASLTHLIIFIASLMIAASVAGTLTNQVDRMSEAIDDKGLDTSKEIRSDIQVITDAGSPVYDVNGNGLIRLHVKNTGTRTLPAQADQIDVIVDGEYISDANLTVTVLDGSDWGTGDVIRLEIDTGLTTGDHRVKLVVGGDEEVFEFRTT